MWRKIAMHVDSGIKLCDSCNNKELGVCNIS